MDDIDVCKLVCCMWNLHILYSLDRLSWSACIVPYAEDCSHRFHQLLPDLLHLLIVFVSDLCSIQFLCLIYV